MKLQTQPWNQNNIKINVSIKIHRNLYILSFKFHCFVKQLFHNIPKTALGLWFYFSAQLNTRKVKIFCEYRKHCMYVLIIFMFPHTIFNISINIGYRPSIIDATDFFFVETWCNLSLNGFHRASSVMSWWRQTNLMSLLTNYVDLYSVVIVWPL